MKRREVIKTIPAVALLSTAGVTIKLEDAEAATAADPGSQSSSGSSKGFSVADPTTHDDPGAYDPSVHCDQFGIDSEGNPISDSLTGTGSDAGLKEHDPDKPHKMKLTQEEQDILNGSQGETMAKVLKTIVMHGELFGAARLADCGGAPHSSLYTGSPWVEPVLEMFEEIADAGLKAHAPYTVNPMPLDLYTVGQDPVKRNMMLDGYPLQGRLIQVHTRFGVLTDEGRKAKWHIDVRLSKEPHFGALGGAVGTKVVEQIPYISGIDQWIPMEDGKPDLVAMGKLKAFGSSTASSGAVGLYHMEKVTPEAQEQGRKLLADDYQTYVIDDAELARVMGTFQNLWMDKDGDPTTVGSTMGGMALMGMKAIGVGPEALLFSKPTDTMPDATYDTALGHWTGFLTKWTMLDRGGNHEGTLAFSMFDRRAIGNHALPASFSQVDVGSLTGNVGFTSWDFVIENLYWEQWFKNQESEFMLRVGNQVVTTLLNPFRFKDDRDHIHLLLFYADERSSRSPDTLPNEAGGGFRLLGEKQWGRWVGFAGYTYNTAEGGGVTGTLAKQNFTLGAAYLNPADITGEISFSLLYLDPIKNIFPDARNQYGIEAYWRISLTRNIWITPGVHLVFDPALNPHHDFIAIPHLKFRVVL